MRTLLAGKRQQRRNNAIGGTAPHEAMPDHRGQRDNDTDASGRATKALRRELQRLHRLRAIGAVAKRMRRQHADQHRRQDQGKERVEPNDHDCRYDEDDGEQKNGHVGG